MGAAPDGVARFFARRHTLPAGSGTVALAVTLEAAGARGRRVLIPALSCPNVAVAVVAAGATPVTVDMDPSTWDMSLSALERALEVGAAAVVAIDPFGYPAAIGAIAERARARGCVVVEDACQAYGGSDGGVPLGGRGDAAVVSFGYAKPLELGGGGLVLTDDDDLASRVGARLDSPAFSRLPALKNRFAVKFMLRDRYDRMLRWDARAGLLRYRFPPRLLDVLGARFEAWRGDIDTVRAHLDRVRALVPLLPGVAPLDWDATQWLPWRYSFRMPSASDRDALVAAMARHGIRVSRLYRPVSELFDVGGEADAAAARRLADETVNLACRTTPADTRSLAGRLERLVEEVGRRG